MENSNKSGNKSFDDTGDIVFDNIFDSEEGFAEVEDFDEAGEGFADENDFDENRASFADENDYEENQTGFVDVPEEEFFDDHVDYFYDDEFAANGTVQFDSDEDFGTRNSARRAKDNIEAGSGVRVHKKPIVQVDEAQRRKAAKPRQVTPPEEDIDEFLEEDADGRRGSSNKVIEKMMMGLAACVVIALIVVGVGFALMKNKSSAPASNINENGIAYNPELGGAGAELAGINMIGGKGLQAAFKEKTGDEVPEDIADVDDPIEVIYEENDYENEVEVAFETVSVVKDLKVKMINKKTGKLIANVPFVVTVTTPSGTIQTWTDSDKDGIIYYSEIAAGSYKLHLEELDKTKFAGYTLPSDTSANVKATLAYEKVDVSGEILAAGDVNEATEDTARDGADAGSGSLANTVTFVESTKKEGYLAVPSGTTINVPFQITAKADEFITSDSSDYEMVAEEGGENGSGSNAGDGGTGTGDAGTGGSGTGGSGTGEGGSGTGDAGTGEGGNGETTPENTDTRKIELGKDAVSVTIGKTVDVTVTITKETTDTVSCVSSSESNAKATYSEGKITIEGVAAGSATVTISIKREGKDDVTKTIAVTVVDKGGITFAQTTLGVLKGKNNEVGVTFTNITAADIEIASSKTDVATATFTADNTKIKVTGVAAGTADIVLKSKTDETITATFTVTVYDSSTKLTATINGNTVQLFVQENGAYREAVYSDYVPGTTTATSFFYASPVYTGWQTIDGKTYYYTADNKPVTGEQVINGVLYNFDSTGAMVVGNGTLGIDVSKWNGDINWAKVKAAGVSYVIIRVGYRGSTLGGLIDDTNFKKNIEGATAAGLKVGVYFVTQAVNDAEAVYEASMVLDRISKYTISYPVFLDVETSGGRGDKIDVATRTSVCKTFCKTIQNAGYTAGIYANKSWLTTMIDTSQLSGYKIWCAQYYKTCTYTGGYQMWQYTDSGVIDGISGKVDLNKSYLGY